MLKKLLQFSANDKTDKLTCSELIGCVYNLNDTDLRVFRAVSKNDGIPINQLGRFLKKDRSTVYRSLEKLVACNLCYKQRRSGQTRGFVDYYHAIAEEEAIKKAEQRLDACYLKLKKLMQNDIK